MPCTRSRAKYPLPQARHRLRVAGAPLQRYPAVVRAGRPSFGGQRTAVPLRWQNTESAGGVSHFRARSQTHVQAAAPVFLRTAGPARSRSTKAPCQFSRRPFGPRCQRWYASACKHKAWVRLVERGLTLPSRGQLPAYGLQLPLMSNVRRHKMSKSFACPVEIDPLYYAAIRTITTL